MGIMIVLVNWMQVIVEVGEVNGHALWEKLKFSESQN